MGTASDLVRRHQIIEADKATTSLGLPRGFQGDRGSVTLQDVERANRATISDLDAGRISKEQAAIEVRTLDAWQSALTKKAGAGTPPPAGSKSRLNPTRPDQGSAP